MFFITIVYAKRWIQIYESTFFTTNIKIYFDTAPFFSQLNELINNSFSKKNNQKDALVTSLDGNKYNLDICPINDGDIFVGWLLILKDLKEI
ncbi:hypothetical protein, partial [Clostridium perfringens]